MNENLSDLGVPTRCPPITVTIPNLDRADALRLISQTGREFVLRSVDYDAGSEDARVIFDVYQGPWIVHTDRDTDGILICFMYAVCVVIGFGIGYFLFGR